MFKYETLWTIMENFMKSKLLISGVIAGCFLMPLELFADTMPSCTPKTWSSDYSNMTSAFNSFNAGYNDFNLRATQYANGWKSITLTGSGAWNIENNFANTYFKPLLNDVSLMSTAITNLEALRKHYSNYSDMSLALTPIDFTPITGLPNPPFTITVADQKTNGVALSLVKPVVTAVATVAPKVKAQMNTSSGSIGGDKVAGFKLIVSNWNDKFSSRAVCP